MSALCSARRLDPFYYEGALVLWMRVRSSYMDYTTALLHNCLIERLITALHLTIKFCGPSDTTYHCTTLLQASEHWHDVTPQKLLAAEIDMCCKLDWHFF